MRNPVQIAAKLYECRDAAKFLLGDKYHERMAAYGEIVKSTANAMECGEIKAAMTLASKNGGMAAMLYMASVVEMTEPSNGELTGSAASSPIPG